MDSDEPNLSRPRDVSFSSYHRMVGENFVLNLPEPIHKPSAQTPSRRRAEAKSTEGELGVFAAERYYNSTVDDGHDESPTTIVKLTSRKQNLNNLGTPSTRSEASSSWNSQSALLSIKRRSKKTSFFSGLSCNGRSCSDKNSVTVAHWVPREQQQRKPVKKCEALQMDPKLVVFDGTKQSLPRYLLHPGDDHLLLSSSMSITSLSNRSESSFRRPQLAQAEEARNKDGEEGSRMSLEVFGSKKGGGEIERKLSMLTWDAIPSTHSTVKGGGGGHDEIESDASSDLFEIENISSHDGSSQQQQQQQPRLSCTSVYEPSEASIEWSVVTASVADFSVNQEYDEKKVEMLESKNLGKSNDQKSRPGGILGCKSHKAVRVVEPGPVYRSTGPGGGGGNEKDTRSQHHNHLQRQHHRTSKGSGSRSGDFDLA